MKQKVSQYTKLFWNEWKLNPNNTGYNVNFVYKLQGKLNPKRLITAFRQIVSDNILYRSYFKEDSNNILFQYFTGKFLEDGIVFKDLSNKIDDKEILIKRYFNSTTNYKFDLTSPPLYRFTLLKIDKEKYLLIINFHHIITDGTTVSFFIKKLSELYNGNTIDLKNCYYKQSSSYLDYELKHLTPEKHKIDNAVKYWTELIGAPSNVPDFIFGRRKLRSKSKYASCCSFKISKYLLNKLINFSNENKISMFNILAAVWGIVISRYSKENNFLLTYPVNARPKEFSSLPGSLVNTLPLFIKIHKNDSFESMTKLLQQQRKEACKVQNIPFSNIFSALVQAGLLDSSGKNLNITIADTAQYRLLKPDFKDIKAERINVHNIASSELCLEYSFDGNSLILQIDYLTKFFNDAYINNMTSHFKVILSKCLNAPKDLLRNNSLLSYRMYKKILFDLNETGVEYNEKKTLKELFEDQVERTPNKIALVFNNEKITYNQLNIKVNQLAHAIRKLYSDYFGKEVKSDTFIGIYMERGIGMIVGILAILKSGAAYIPFDLHDPTDRLKYKIDDCSTKMVLTVLNNVKDLVFLMREDALPVSIDTYWHEISKFPSTNPETANTSNDLAYVIYTSGSTGNPKGVMIEQKTVHNLILLQRKSLQINSQSKCLQFSSINFDASVWEIFVALTSGAELHIIPEALRVDPNLLYNYMLNNEISHATFPPVTLSIFPLKRLPALKVLAIAGDTCRKYVMDYWSDKTFFINAYGPTEATVCSTMSNYNTKMANTNIGYPVQNTKLYVLDDHLEPVPYDVPGELYIGGKVLARGYLNRPELTSERFISYKLIIKNELLEEERIYKTGDIVRRLSNGSLEFIGRNDFQVKISGYRIEINEIEAVFSKHKSIKQCLIIPHEHKISNAKSLVAYYITSASISPVDLKVYLSTHLPYYMIPSIFIEMKEFPVNVSGKIDRGRLPNPENIESTSNLDLTNHSDYNNMRGIIKSIWESVLNISNIGLQESFFELGGNSIILIQLIDRINVEFKLNLSGNFIYNHKTVESQAVALGEKVFSPHEPIIYFNKIKEKDILILIHPTGAGAEVYYKMVQQLDLTRFNVIGINSYNINNPDNPRSDLNYIAKYYSNLLIEKFDFKEENIYLGGWSSGGNIAYDVADVLLEKGFHVRGLFLFDSFLFSAEDNNKFDFNWQQRFVERQLFLAGVPTNMINKINEFIRLESIGMGLLRYNCLDINTFLFKCKIARPYEELIKMDKKEKLEAKQFNELIMSLKDNGWSKKVNNLFIIDLPVHHGEIITNELSSKKISKFINKEI